MNLETATQRIVVLAVSLAFLAVLATVFGTIVTSLDETNQSNLGHWFEHHWGAIWKTAAALLPAVITYLFGRGAGRKVGKTEGFNHAIATAEGTPTANVLRREAQSIGLRVS